jgi:hypothetical protein
MDETPLWVLLREAGVPGASGAVDQLAGRLAEIGSAAPAGGVRPPGQQVEMLSLMPLAYRPRLLVRLDERSRRAVWRLTTRWWRVDRWVTEASADEPWHAVRDLVAGFDRDPEAAGQIAVAFAATDSDGRRRERAIAVMAARQRPEHLPFLVLRCDDWVGQVREPARAAMVAMLRERPEHLLRVALPMAAHLTGRRRGGTALRIIEQLVESDFDRYAPILLQDREQCGRRLAFTVGSRQGRWSYADLLGFAMREPDPAVRLEAAGAVTREAVHRRDLPALRDLATARFVAVRALALAGLSELGHNDEVVAALTDPAPLIRAFARSRATDPAGRYRSLISAAHTTPPADASPVAPSAEAASAISAAKAANAVSAAEAASAVPSAEAANFVSSVEVARFGPALPEADAEPVFWAIVGLAEVGDRRDAGLLTSLLRHPGHRIRAAAVRGLALIDSIPVEETLPLLTDPARDVVREASLALRVYRRRIPAELPWTLLADPRPEVRHGGFRLLTNRAPVVRLAAALTLATDSDMALAQRGRMTAIQLIPALSAGVPEPGDEPPASLPELLERARPALGRHYDQLCAAVATHHA